MNYKNLINFLVTELGAVAVCERLEITRKTLNNYRYGQAPGKFAAKEALRMMDELNEKDGKRC